MGTFSDAEIAWAAGLFEGEGCISVQHVDEWTYARLSLGMTDEDSVRRFHCAVGMGSVDRRHTPSSREHGWKPQWTWRTNRAEEVRAVVELLWPGLGRRRRVRWQEVLAASEASPRRILKTHCVHGHEYTSENTIWRNQQQTERRCRKCARRASREYQRRRREEVI